MSNNENKLQPNRQKLTEEFLERYRENQPAPTLAQSNEALEKQFRLPRAIWDKLKTR